MLSLCISTLLLFSFNGCGGGGGGGGEVCIGDGQVGDLPPLDPKAFFCQGGRDEFPWVNNIADCTFRSMEKNEVPDGGTAQAQIDPQAGTAEIDVSAIAGNKARATVNVTSGPYQYIGNQDTDGTISVSVLIQGGSFVRSDSGGEGRLRVCYFIDEWDENGQNGKRLKDAFLFRISGNQNVLDDEIHMADFGLKFIDGHIYRVLLQLRADAITSGVSQGGEASGMAERFQVTYDVPGADPCSCE